MRTQIHKDALTILTEIGKKSTNLSLALKKSTKQQQQAEGESPSPTARLDAGSIAAAQQQIDALTNDLLPKLVFLAQKACKERSVYVVGGGVDDDDKDDDSAAKEERARLEAVAKEMGGSVMTGAELGLSSSPQSSRYVKQANLGIGGTWSHILRLHTQDVLQSIASLGEACMDARTKKAVRAAQQARDRFDGLVGGGKTGDDTDAIATREQCLAKVAAVWDACDQAVKSLPSDNVSAVKKRWDERKEIMQDGLDEMRDALEDGDEQGDGDQDADDSADDLGLDISSMTLDASQKKLITRLTPLIRMGKLLHDRVGNDLGVSVDGQDAVDVDDLDERGVALGEAQDDLVAALLYGEVPEDEEEEEEEATPPEAVQLKGTRAVAELYLDAARQLASCHASSSSPSSSSSRDTKVQMIVEEMVKLVDGVEDDAWPRVE